MNGQTSKIDKKSMDIDFLATTALEILNLDPETDPWGYISRELHHWKGAITISCSFEPVTNEIEIRNVGGNKKRVDTFFQQMGIDSIGLLIPLTDKKVKNFLKKRLVKVPGGIYESFSGIVSETICKKVENELQIGSVFTIGLGRQEELYGCIVFILAQGEDLSNAEVVETFIHLASVALHTWKAREIERLYHRELLRAKQWVSLGMLIPGVVHDINNPNSVILLNSEILSQVWQDTLPVLEQYYGTHGDFLLGGVPYLKYKNRIGKFFADMSTGSKQINDIIMQLKKFSQPVQTDISENIAIDEVVKSTLKLLTYRIKRSGRRFFQAYENNLPLIRGNGQQLEQVVLYLLLDFTRAVKNPDGPVSISTSVDNEGRYVSIVIEDKGLYIPKKDLLRIKQPCFIPKSGPGNIGFGLFICTKIFAAHPGKIEIDSQPGKGTIVTLKLPVNRTSPGAKGEAGQ